MSDNLKKFINSLKKQEAEPKPVINPEERYAWVVRINENPDMVKDFIEKGDPSILMDVTYIQPENISNQDLSIRINRESFNIPLNDKYLIRIQSRIERFTVGKYSTLFICGTAKIINVETQEYRFLFSYIFENSDEPSEAIKALNTYYLEDTREYLENLWLSKVEVARTILDITREYHLNTMDTSHTVNTSKTIKGLISAMNHGLKGADILKCIKPYKIGNYL